MLEIQNIFRLAKDQILIFFKKKFKILSIGLNPSKFLTYLHHVEELLKVSHRKWIYISRKLVKKGKY